MLKLRKEFACLLNNAHASNGTFEEVAKKVGLLDGFGSAVVSANAFSS